MKRIFAIGDIHGALKALKQIIQKLQLQKNDSLIFLGDYVDGWSESFGVVEYLIDLQKKYHCVFLRGNHDIWCGHWLKNGAAENSWLLNGGQSTLSSYANRSAADKKKHLTFFEQLRNYYIDEQNHLFVHAGFTSMQGPRFEEPVSNCSWDRTLWEMAITINSQHGQDTEHYPQRLLLFKEIYIGHTPTIAYDVNTPMQACNVYNIDTGAAFWGRLSALNIHTKEFLQSDVCKNLYPGEKGRNND